MDVTVTDDGMLQITIDTVVYPPLSIGAVEALAARIPDAVAAAGRAAVTQIVRQLTGVLAASPGLAAHFTIAGNQATASVDADTFATIQQKWNLTPDPSTGALVMGPVTITQQEATP